MKYLTLSEHFYNTRPYTRSPNPQHLVCDDFVHVGRMGKVAGGLVSRLLSKKEQRIQMLAIGAAHMW